MYYLDVMESFEAYNHLIKNTPNLFLFHISVTLFKFVNFGLQVTSISEFHHNIESLGVLFKKGLLICYDIRMIDRCKNSNLIESVFFLLLVELA